MTEIMSFLFDKYTRDLDTSELKAEIQNNQIQYQRLIKLAGEDEAIEIWDAAASEGAAMHEACFQAGLKTGIALALELLSL